MQAEEEAQRQEGERRAREEEDCLAVKRDLRKEGGPSRERAPRRRLFLPSSDSARSPEKEEGEVPRPSRDKGKGRAPVSEEVQGEITGVICDLCEKNGIPCRWGKVSVPYPFFLLLLITVYRRQPMFGPSWPANKPGKSAMLEVHGPHCRNG